MGSSAVCSCVCIFVHMHKFRRVYICMHASIHIRLYVILYIYVYICVCMCICSYICVYIRPEIQALEACCWPEAAVVVWPCVLVTYLWLDAWNVTHTFASKYFLSQHRHVSLKISFGCLHKYGTILSCWVCGCLHVCIYVYIYCEVEFHLDSSQLLRSKCAHVHADTCRYVYMRHHNGCLFVWSTYSAHKHAHILGCKCGSKLHCFIYEQFHASVVKSGSLCKVGSSQL